MEETEHGEKIWIALEDEPFGHEWFVWCHPETLRELTDECWSLRSDENPVPPTPEERFCRKFKSDRLLPKGEFFVLPDTIDDLEDEILHKPPGQFVRELIYEQGPRRIDEGMVTHIRIDIWYEVKQIEYRFDIDGIKQVREIPALRDLIKTHVPDDHPPASPEHVEWESTKDWLDVEVSDGQWVWTEDHRNKGTRRRLTFNNSMDLDMTLKSDAYENELQYQIEESVNEFVELAIEHIGHVETNEIDGTVSEIKDTDLVMMGPEASFDDYATYETIEKTVGKQITRLGGMCMKPREAQW